MLPAKAGVLTCRRCSATSALPTTGHPKGSPLRFRAFGKDEGLHYTFETNELLLFGFLCKELEQASPSPFTAHALPHVVCTRAHPFEVAMLEVDAR